eukprot:gene9903-20598_t
MFSECAVAKLLEISNHNHTITSGISKLTSSKCTSHFLCPNVINMEIFHRINPCRTDSSDTYIWGVLWVNNDSNRVFQWVLHHLLLGFSHLIIFDNDSKDGLKEALLPFTNENLVELHHSNSTYGQSAQARCYIHALQLAKIAGVTWLALFDADEFLALSQDTCLSSYLHRIEKTKSMAAVGVNWQWIPSNLKLWRDRKPSGDLQFIDIFNDARFKTGIPNQHIKSIVYVNRTITFNHVHFGRYIHNFSSISTTTLTPIIGAFTNPEINNISLLHFHTRSFEEYLLKIGRWTRVKFKSSDCRHCSKSLQTLVDEYSRLAMNTTNAPNGLKYTPELHTTPQHEPTELFMRRQSHLIRTILNGC